MKNNNNKELQLPTIATMSCQNHIFLKNLSQPNWNPCSGLVQIQMNHWFNKLDKFILRMLGSNVVPDKYTFPYVIKACGGLNNVKLCKMVHDLARSMGFHMDLFIGSSLIKLYTDNGYIHDARCLFDELPLRDCILWNVMLNGYVKNGDFKSALGTFQDMRNSYIKPNSSALVDIYFKGGDVEMARKTFQQNTLVDVAVCTAMISGYVLNGLNVEAVNMFRWEGAAL
ncbi:hypothetical protein TSUD_74010 [Trifolium subterraneum]|uniref:Pentatricopeptide repeat-containing protein n=1 Tax=Trifolium subterraneum TaxID=3900 RepID=A0A2Z6LH20_TRISU|nr:hypothetical protein TSUD_74010 [Trifolium subterraneum]